MVGSVIGGSFAVVFIPFLSDNRPIFVFPLTPRPNSILPN